MRLFNWLKRKFQQRPIRIDAVRLTTDPVDGSLLVTIDRGGVEYVVIRESIDCSRLDYWPEHAVTASGIRDAEMTLTLDDYSALGSAE